MTNGDVMKCNINFASNLPHRTNCQFSLRFTKVISPHTTVTGLATLRAYRKWQTQVDSYIIDTRKSILIILRKFMILPVLV